MKLIEAGQLAVLCLEYHPPATLVDGEHGVEFHFNTPKNTAEKRRDHTYVVGRIAVVDGKRVMLTNIDNPNGEWFFKQTIVHTFDPKELI